MVVNLTKTVTVTTSGTPVQINVAPVPIRKLYIQADPNNTATKLIFIGGENLTITSAGDSAGYDLAPGQSIALDFSDYSLPNNADLPLWYLDADANGLKANVFAVRA